MENISTLDDRKPYRRGDVTIGALLSLMLLLGAMVLLHRMNSQYTGMKEQAVVAGQMQDVLDAARQYAEANYATLIAGADAINPATFTFADVQAAGFLSAGAINRNAWGQSYGFYALEPSANILQLVVLTEGGRGHDAARPGFGSLDVPGAAQLVGASGGYVPTGLLPSEPNTILQGVGGGWDVDFTANAIPNPGAGHIGGMVWLAEGSMQNDFLYRVAVPGRPELNEMQTSLDMSGQDILMGDGEIGGGDTEGLRVINFEDHNTAEFTCADNDDLGGQLFYVDRGPEADADEALKSGGLYICRAGMLRKVFDEGNFEAGEGEVVPVGTVMPSATSDLPGNTSDPNPDQATCRAVTSEAQAEANGCTWLEADGSSLRRVAYPSLFAKIGTTYGGSGAFFNLPDLRGEFVRGWDHGRGADAGRSLGTSQGDATSASGLEVYGAHGPKDFQQADTLDHDQGVHVGIGGRRDRAGTASSYVGADPLGAPFIRGDSETRPRNVAMMYIVKAL